MTKSKFKEIADKIGSMVEEKNVQYGDSYANTQKFLDILYPESIPVEKFSDIVCIIRIFDKLKKVAAQVESDEENPYADLIGITIRMADNQEG